ncbi:RISC-loading complex subunit tarbp2 [Orchesella cincta]|uniref:RISC-loading complex subunit tarbp2 n=1 Tax=Orchesella cincta TaxID=48709 RepID=A0A1D2N8E1_ORCCI|nr:RISC-loading complex subunit tarbp2 [Orchesella cincta]
MASEAAKNSIFGKTPKAWLSEYCAKKKFPPANWTYKELSKIPSRFMATCLITTIEGEHFKEDGFGPTKKDAEHCASQRLFAAMNVTIGELYNMTPQGKQAKKEEQGLQVQQRVAKATSSTDAVDNNQDNGYMSDSDENILGDPVGKLITLCQRNGIAAPLYEENHERGPANSNIFTVTCSVGELSLKSARGSRKVNAKKVAAHRVFLELEKKGYYHSKTTKSPTKPCPVSSSQKATSSSSSSSSSSSARSTSVTSTGSTQDGNPLKRELDIVLAKEGKKAKAASSQSSNDVDDQRMQIDVVIENIKRKLMSDDDDKLNGDSKRSRLLDELSRLVCYNKGENSCLQFVTNYSHVFQHLPTSSEVDDALATLDYINSLNKHGGALAVLQQTAKQYKIKMTFTQSIKEVGSTTNVVVFLKMKLPPCNFQKVFQRQLVVNGVGNTKDNAKLSAAVEALRLLNLMLYDNTKVV